LRAQRRARYREDALVAEWHFDEDAKDTSGMGREQMYRERMADHQKFQDTMVMVHMTDRNADRAERMAGKSMEQMGATATRGQAAVPTTLWRRACGCWGSGCSCTGE